LRPLSTADSGLFAIMHPIMKMYRFILLVCLACAASFFSACGNGSGDNTIAAADSTGTDSVLAALNKKIADEPDNFANYLARAQYYGKTERYDLAMKDIARAIETDSLQSTIYLYRGEIHWAQENVNKAYDDYKQCLALEATNTDCLLKKAAIDIVLNNYTIALQHINDALRQGDQAYAYYLKGRLYKQQGDTASAISAYQTAVEVDATYYDAFIEVGLLFAAQKNDLAKDYYNSAIEIRPNSIEAWYNKAMFFQETGNKDQKRYQEALTCYDKIISIDSTFATAHFNKGFVYLEYLKDLKSSEKEFTEAVLTNPSYFMAYYNRGLVYERMGKKDEAERDFRKALSIKPDYTDAAKGVSRILGE
jgi:tetratricopeptide (TPR) repeat protein